MALYTDFSEPSLENGGTVYSYSVSNYVKQAGLTDDFIIKVDPKLPGKLQVFVTTGTLASTPYLSADRAEPTGVLDMPTGGVAEQDDSYVFDFGVGTEYVGASVSGATVTIVINQSTYL